MNFDMKKFNDWCELFLSKATQPMSSDIRNAYVACFFNEQNGDDIFPEIRDERIFRFVQDRAEVLGLECTNSLLCFIAVISRSPGVVVMYLSALRSKYKPSDIPVGMSFLTTVFPLGFLSDEDLSRCWDSQKCETAGTLNDNMLDRAFSSHFE